MSDDGFVDDMGEEDVDEEYTLAQELAALTERNETLRTENQVLDAYVSRVNPEIYAMEISKGPQQKDRRGKDAAPSKNDRNLSYEEKTDLAAMEIEHVHKRIAQVKEAAERQIDELACSMEAVDIRIAETKKDTYEFKRDIIVGAENPRTGKTMAEKMLRFMEDRLRVKEVSVEKLKLKNMSIKAQIAKMEMQLQQKEDMGEVLHVIDFDQLKIENQQYLEKIEERNNELLRMKLSTGRTIQTLNNMKNRLGELVVQGEQLRKDIAEREAILSRFEDDMVSVHEGRKQASKGFRIQKLEAEDTDRPQVMDYIYLTAEVQNIQKQVADWERKLEIAQMEEKRTRKMYKTMSQSMHRISGTPPTIPPTTASLSAAGASPQ